MNSNSNSPSISAHKKLYKHQSPHWKDTYRKRCHERLQKSREKFLFKFRAAPCVTEEAAAGSGEPSATSMVKDLMREEWQRLSEEHSGLPSLSTASSDLDFDNLKDENIDEVLSVFEEIREELLLEERQILAEYEAGVCFDEAALTATLECLSSVEVLCPVCTRSKLHLNKGVVFCSCGIRVDTEQDCISLEYVKQNIEEGVATHESFCEGCASFTVMKQVGVDNLIMTCQACDYMYIVV